MAAFAKTTAEVRSGLLPIIAAAIMGLGLIVVAGHVQSATLHDAAHDTRHAAGFPCH